MEPNVMRPTRQYPGSSSRNCSSAFLKPFRSSVQMFAVFCVHLEAQSSNVRWALLPPLKGVQGLFFQKKPTFLHFKSVWKKHESPIGMGGLLAGPLVTLLQLYERPGHCPCS